MEVFALELAVKEKGLATVEAGLAGVRKEARKTAEAVTDAFTGPQRAIMVSRAQVAANAGSMERLHEEALALDRTMPRALNNMAKGSDLAALRVTHLATQFATTGNISVAAVGGIQSALTKLGVSVGTGGVVAGAFLGFATLIKHQLDKVKAEAKAAVDAVLAEGARLRDRLNDIAEETDADALARRRKRLQEGLAFAAPMEAGITVEQAEGRGIQRLREDVERLNAVLAVAKERTDAWARGTTVAGMTRRELARVIGEEQRVMRETPALIATATNALASLTAQMNTVIVTTARMNEVVAGPRGRMPDASGAGATAVGTRFDEIVRNAQASIAARFAGPLSQFARGGQLAALVEAQLALDLEETFAKGVSNGIIDGFALGIERAIASGDIGEGFKAMTAQMLAGMGNAMVQFGAQAMVFGKLMEVVKRSLTTLSGVRAVAAGAALIAAGAALRGVASRMFGGAGSPGGTGGFGSGSGGITGLGGEGSVTRIVFGPTAAGVAAGMTPRAVNQFVVIGPNDPTAQRAIGEILAKSERRGGLG